MRIIRKAARAGRSPQRSEAAAGDRAENRSGSSGAKRFLSGAFLSFFALLISFAAPANALAASAAVSNGAAGAAYFGTVKLPSGREDQFAENNILFYDPNGVACTSKSSMTTVPGDDVASVIWNYLGQEVGITNPAIAAGVLGNTFAEASNDPYVDGNGTGLIQIIDDAKQVELKNYVNSKVPDGSSYWHAPGTSSKAPEDIEMKAAIAELDFIFKDDSTWSKETARFIKNIGVVTSNSGTKGARAYSDLWLVVVEKAVNGSDPIEDPGVKKLASSTLYQAAEKRRDAAEDYYNKFAANGTETKFVPTATAAADTGIRIADNDDETTDSGSDPAASKTGTTDGTSSGKGVYLIGDSISEGVKNLGKFDDDLPDMAKDTKVGRRFDEGIPLLETYLKDHPDTKIVIYALGTNFGVTDDNINTVISDVGNRQLYFVTNYGQPSSGDWKTAYDDNNKKFISAASSHDNVHVIDWAAKLKGDGTKLDPNDYLNTDPGMEVHPNDKGATLWADMITAAVRGTSAGAGSYDTCECPPGMVGAVASNGMFDEDGWLVSSFPGYTKESAEGNSKLKEHPKTEYKTDDKKPHQILLHSTEGTGLGLSAYGDNMYPAHFMIDLKKKQVRQAFPITHPSVATKGSDGSTVQIEIVGFSTSNWSGNDYYLPSFVDENWDYLALLLIAISGATGIPLSSTLDWSPNHRMSSTTERDNYRGVMGHMHSPGDDHTDPGDIWDKVNAALGRNPDASQFSSSVCSFGGGNGDINSTAVSLAWPVKGEHGPEDPKPEYRTALEKVGFSTNSDTCVKQGSSCDVFVATSVRYSGADPDFKCCGASNVLTYLENSSKWQEVTNNKDSLRGGDVRASSGHVELIVNVNGELKIASASSCDRTGEIGDFYDNSSKFKAFRLVK